MITSAPSLVHCYTRPAVIFASVVLACLGMAQPVNFTANNGTYNWSGGANWSTGTAPTDVAIQRIAGANSVTLTLDQADRSVRGIAVLQSATNGWTINLSSNNLTLGNGGAGVAITLNANSSGARLILTSPSSGTWGSLVLTDDLTITNTSYTAAVTNPATLPNSSGSIVIGAPITGTGNLTIRNAVDHPGRGAVKLDRSNSFVGNVNIESGVTTFLFNALGNSANQVTLGKAGAGNAALYYTLGGGTGTIVQNMTIAGDTGGTVSLGAVTMNLSGTLGATKITYSGNLTLNGNLNVVASNIGSVTTNQTVVLSGTISGVGGIVTEGTNIRDSSEPAVSNNSVLAVQMTGNNNFTGETRMKTVDLQIGAASGNASLALQGSTVNLASGDTGSLQFGVSNTTTITSATFGGLTGSRNLALQNINTTPAAVALKVGRNGGDTTYDGVLSGAGSLEIINGGKLTLTAAQQYTGVTTVTNGTLVLNGSTHASSALTVAEDGVLGGSGTINGSATIAGTHNPGNSPGVQTFSGDLTYTAGATVNWELTANTSTQGNPAVFDQIIVGGLLNFAGATTLNLSFNSTGSTVNWSDSFWSSERSWLIYDNASLSNFSNLSLTPSNWADSAGGLFGTLRPDGSFYLTTAGNDVYLNYTAVPEPSTYAAIAGALALAFVALRRRYSRV